MSAAPSISIATAVLGVQVLSTGAAWVLRRRERTLMRLLPYLVSVAVGVLLATALLHLLPDAVAALGAGQTVPLLMGASILGLFTTERMVYALTGAAAEQPDAAAVVRAHKESHDVHHHHPAERCAPVAGAHAGRQTGPGNLLLASMLHSLVDGATIAAAFSAGERTGWLAATAVTLHEVPHRMGDFALLVQMRMPLSKALRFAALAGVPALLGMAAVMVFGGAEQGAVRLLLPVSAGSFLYIALVNLLPEIQVECRRARVVAQLLCLFGGVALVLLVGALPEH